MSDEKTTWDVERRGDEDGRVVWEVVAEGFAFRGKEGRTFGPSVDEVLTAALGGGDAGVVGPAVPQQGLYRLLEYDGRYRHTGPTVHVREVALELRLKISDPRPPVSDIP